MTKTARIRWYDRSKVFILLSKKEESWVANFGLLEDC